MSQPQRFAGTTGHPVGETKTGLAVGMDKGRVVTKLELKQKPSYRKGVRSPPPPSGLGDGLNRAHANAHGEAYSPREATLKCGKASTRMSLS